MSGDPPPAPPLPAPLHPLPRQWRGRGVGPGSPAVTLRFAALGDSLTEGLGDPFPDGGCRGWAALLAAGLPAPGGRVRLANLARSGARTLDAAAEQLPAARLFRPHVAAVVIGVNDTLRSAFDVAHATRALDTVIGALTGDGAVVLTACLPDPGRMLRLPRSLGRPLARRMGALNDVVHALSLRHGALHAHLAGHPMVADRAAWSVDRLHPSELGHRLLAREFHALLAAHGAAGGPPPSATPERPPPGHAAGAWWMATRGTRWVLARSTDLLPGLLRLALAEARHRLAGTEDTLDRAAREATSAALREGLARPPDARAAPGPPGPAPEGDEREPGMPDRT